MSRPARAAKKARTMTASEPPKADAVIIPSTKSLIIRQCPENTTNTMWLIPDGEISELERTLLRDACGVSLQNDKDNWVLSCLWRLEEVAELEGMIYGDDDELVDMTEEFRTKYCPKDVEGKWSHYEVPGQDINDDGDRAVTYVRDNISQVYLFFS